MDVHQDVTAADRQLVREALQKDLFIQCHSNHERGRLDVYETFDFPFLTRNLFYGAQSSIARHTVFTGTSNVTPSSLMRTYFLLGSTRW